MPSSNSPMSRDRNCAIRASHRSDSAPVFGGAAAAQAQRRMPGAEERSQPRFLGQPEANQVIGVHRRDACGVAGPLQSTQHATDQPRRRCHPVAPGVQLRNARPADKVEVQHRGRRVGKVVLQKGTAAERVAESGVAAFAAQKQEAHRNGRTIGGLRQEVCETEEQRQRRTIVVRLPVVRRVKRERDGNQQRVGPASRHRHFDDRRPGPLRTARSAGAAVAAGRRRTGGPVCTARRSTLASTRRRVSQAP